MEKFASSSVLSGSSLGSLHLITGSADCKTGRVPASWVDRVLGADAAEIFQRPFSTADGEPGLCTRNAG
jgi:hypothetical protein